MTREKCWGAPTEDERWLAMGTLLTFASPDGSLSDAERRVIAWAGRELAFDRVSGDLADVAHGISSPACRKELVRVIVLVLDARGHATVEDLAILGHLTRSWNLPMPEIAPHGDPGGQAGPADLEASMAVRRAVLDCRLEAIDTARSWRRVHWAAVGSMVVMTCGFGVLCALPVILAIPLLPPALGGLGATLDPAVRVACTLGALLISPFLAGLVLGLRGATARDALYGGFIVGAIPLATFVACVVNPVRGHARLPVATLVPMLGLGSAWMGHLGVRTARRLRPNRPV